MTLADISASPKDFLSCADIAPYLKCDPNVLRDQAKQRPELLGFPIVRMGNRVKIPRDLFVQFFSVVVTP